MRTPRQLWRQTSCGPASRLSQTTFGALLVGSRSVQHCFGIRVGLGRTKGEVVSNSQGSLRLALLQPWRIPAKLLLAHRERIQAESHRSRWLRLGWADQVGWEEG